MNTRLTHSALAASLLTLLAATAGHAQIVQLAAPPVGYATTTTDDYPLDNDNGGHIQGPFTVAAGDVDVTFTAVNPGVNSFETFQNFDDSVAFAHNAIVIDTFDGDNNGFTGPTPTQKPTGPVLINFSSGVSAFGLNVESARDDTAIFSFTAYDGGNVMFTSAPVTVTQSEGNHQSIFLGAQGINGDLITSVQISDTSLANGTYDGGSNDFFFGPLSTFAPVPEASTTVSFGLLLMLGLGGALIAARRKSAAPTAAKS